MGKPTNPRQYSLINSALGILLLGGLSLLMATIHHLDDSSLIASEKQLVTPVLKGKADNPIVRIKLTVPAGTAPTELRAFAFTSEGTTQLSDLSQAKVYYGGTDSLFRTSTSPKPASLFGATATPGKTFTIAGQQSLSPGDHYFWLSFELNSRADLLHRIDASCLKVTLNSGSISPTNPANTIRQRIGIALRQHNDDTVHTYRIPGLTTSTAGTLFAVYDARRESTRDLQGDIDIGLSRSANGGKTWEPMRVVLDKGAWGGLPEKFNGVSDACVLVDNRSNTIYIAGLWMYGIKNDQGVWVDGLTASSKDWNHQWRTKGSGPGFDVKQTAQFLITKSTDDGKTWSEPVNVTRMVKQENWWLLAPAPGHGITLADGTLVFPSQGRNETGHPFATITYSKDGGKTWQTGQPAHAEATNENMAAQLSDGGIMLNMRAGKNRTDSSNTNGRAIAITYDLGKTWREHPTSFGALPEPTCMASLHKHAFKQNRQAKTVLLFSNPNSKKARHHMTIKVSLDDGMTWPKQHWLLLDELKGNGYSCLTSVDEQTVGILYESSQANLVFQKIPLADLLKP